jgi:hypothetical protein
LNGISGFGTLGAARALVGFVLTKELFMNLQKRLERQLEVIEASMRRARKDGKYKTVAALAGQQLETVKLLLSTIETERANNISIRKAG